MNISPSRICVASIWTPNQQELAEITVENKRKYCEKNGYSGAFLLQAQAYLGFDKILFIEGLLNTGKYDVIYWCDNDTIFTNFNKKIEDLLDEDYHFFISTDESQNVNAGVFIIRNSSAGREYLQRVKSKMYELEPINIYKFGEEQTGLIATYQEAEFKQTVKILPQKLMNAYPYSGVRHHPQGKTDALGVNGDWERGDLMLHIPGFGHDFYDRLVVHMKHYAQQVIQ